MWKKVVGILAVIFGSVSLLFALIFGGVFGGFGAVFGMVDDVNERNLRGMDETVTGEVSYVTGEETYIQYEVDGITYEGSVTLVSSHYPQGSEIEVYYDPGEPTRFGVPDLSEEVWGTMHGIFGTLGIVFAILFGVFGIAGITAGILLLRSYHKNVIKIKE